MNFERLYAYRFRGIDQASRDAVWSEIAPFVWNAMGRPRRLLDPAAGRLEFMAFAPADERWAVDHVRYEAAGEVPGLRFIEGDARTIELPPAHFDGIWISNFLEHLDSQEAVAAFLERMHAATAPGGRIAIMGPNIRYCADEYWDCADHTVALSHVAIAEHLYAAGFEPIRVEPRFLPYSFRGRLPASRRLTRTYLRLRLAWRLLGKQFLVVGERRA